MIPVANPIAEPPNFDANCRQLGNAWLALNPNASTKEFPNHWAQFEDELATGFQHRCGWLAFEITEGDVDHYLSKKNHRHLSYEWTNYRYIAGTVNSSKRNRDDQVLDPFEVQQGWFVVGLPDMQVRRTDVVPQPLRAKADFTITQLKLNARKHRRTRLRHYQRHKDGIMSIELLRAMNPLVGAAVDAFRAANPAGNLP